MDDLRGDDDRVGLGNLRLVCKDWRAAVDAKDSGLKRWMLHTHLGRQPPPLPRTAVLVEALDLRSLFNRRSNSFFWIGQSLSRQGLQSVRALQHRVPVAFPSLRSLMLHFFNMNGCVQAHVCSWISAVMHLPRVCCSLHEPGHG